MGQDRNIEEANGRIKAFTIEDDEEIVQNWMNKIEASISTDSYEQNDQQLQEVIDKAQADIFARAAKSCQLGNKIRAQNILENYSNEMLSFFIKDSDKKFQASLILQGMDNISKKADSLDLNKKLVKKIDMFYQAGQAGYRNGQKILENKTLSNFTDKENMRRENSNKVVRSF